MRPDPSPAPVSPPGTSVSQPGHPAARPAGRAAGPASRAYPRARCYLINTDPTLLPINPGCSVTAASPARACPRTGHETPAAQPSWPPSRSCAQGRVRVRKLTVTGCLPRVRARYPCVKKALAPAGHGADSGRGAHHAPQAQRAPGRPASPSVTGMCHQGRCWAGCWAGCTGWGGAGGAGGAGSRRGSC